MKLKDRSLQLHSDCGNVRPNGRGWLVYAASAATEGFAERATLFSQRKTDGRIVSMKKMLALSLALAAAVSVSACQTPQQQNALVGGALGGGTGALIGSAVSHGSAGGTLAGAAIGAASGAMIGSAATPPPPPYAYGAPPPYAGPPPAGPCARWGYDYNGNRVCVAYY
jgi:hypothetical protein